MKRVLSIVLAVLCVASMAVAFTSCSDSSDWAKVEDKGYFVCGITEYAPMNYYEGEGDDKVLVGFDTEFAKAVAKELGVEVKFQIIDWPNKYTELNSGNIDLIWNGFTYGMESDGVSRTEYVDFTYSYLENRQCLVTKADRVNELNTADALKGKKGVAEGGSSGEGVAQDIAGNKDLITTFSSQRNALMELISGNADFAVIDYQMANSMVGKGDYASLAINKAVEPESEVYAIGCRKGSDLTEKINEAIKKLSEDGTLAKLAEKYGLTNDLIPNIGSDK
jgi:polar amino acid transport system substrate-binding protein